MLDGFLIALVRIKLMPSTKARIVEDLFLGIAPQNIRVQDCHIGGVPCLANRSTIILVESNIAT